jgi:hypothetical protein
MVTLSEVVEVAGNKICHDGIAAPRVRLLLTMVAALLCENQRQAWYNFYIQEHSTALHVIAQTVKASAAGPETS